MLPVVFIRIEASDLVADHVAFTKALRAGAVDSAVVILPSQEPAQGHGPRVQVGHEALPCGADNAGGNEIQDIGLMHFFLIWFVVTEVVRKGGGYTTKGKSRADVTPKSDIASAGCLLAPDLTTRGPDPEVGIICNITR